MWSVAGARPLVRSRASGILRSNAPAAGNMIMPQQQQRGLASDSIVDKIKNFFVFFPQGKDYVQYAEKSDIQGIKGFRYPAPSERSAGVNVPEDDEGDPYNIQYYTRDTARNQTPTMISKTPESIKALNLEEKPILHEGSKGNNNPAVLRYDPVGTRSAMSTTWTGMEDELQKHRPTHLAEPWWYKAGIDDYKDYSEPRGLPPRAGKPMRFGGQKPTGNW